VVPSFNLHVVGSVGFIPEDDSTSFPLMWGDAPDFVEVGEAGIAMDDAMRRQRRVQLVG
jgi:hypothetical protein